MTDSSPSSPFTGDNSKSPNDAVEKQSAADMLLQGNQELRASIVSNVITKGLVGLGVGVGLALFVFKRKPFAILPTDIYDSLHRQSGTSHVYNRLRSWNVLC
jgi:hypothetical protein